MKIAFGYGVHFKLHAQKQVHTDLSNLLYL